MLRKTWKSGLSVASCAISARCFRPVRTAEMERCSSLRIPMDSFISDRRFLPRFAQPYGGGREVRDAAEELPEVMLAHAGDGIAVRGKGRVDGVPVLGAQVAPGKRQQLFLLLAHVRPVEGRVILERRVEFEPAGRPALLEEEERALEVPYQPRARYMVARQLLDQRSRLLRAGGEAREQELVFLGMVQPLRELVDVA